MTRRFLFVTALLCVIFAGSALAADVTGDWSGTMKAGDDPIPLTFTFKQAGEKLTGTVVSPQAGALPLRDGKVQGEKITFFVMAEMNGSPTKFVTEGTVKGDEMSLNIRAEGVQDFGTTVLKRVK